MHIDIAGQADRERGVPLGAIRLSRAAYQAIDG